ncbi:MAG TPA: hypothetical protein VHT24_14870 [Pseudacidobacterium sp.]|jgi:hypothetical protein|nr:hypothetical protein [Pseudacidobacterium sp.]
MPYELTYLSGGLLKLLEIDNNAQHWLAGAASGHVLGRWRTDIGLLGRIVILRDFENTEDLLDERRRALLSSNPFNGNGIVEEISQESYQDFEFLPPAVPGVYGGVYEIRIHTAYIRPKE